MPFEDSGNFGGYDPLTSFASGFDFSEAPIGQFGAGVEPGGAVGAPPPVQTQAPAPAPEGIDPTGFSLNAPYTSGAFGDTQGVNAGPGTPPTPPTPSGFDRFASGLAHETLDSPLKAFATALGLGATGLGVSNQLGVAGQLARQTRALTRAQDIGTNLATKGTEVATAALPVFQKGTDAALAAGAPASAFGKTTLESAAAGKLPQAMEDSIAAWAQKAKADMRGRYASMGLGNSSDLQHEEARIDQMAQEIRGQLIQGQEQIGLEGLRTGVAAGTGVAGVAGGTATGGIGAAGGANNAVAASAQNQQKMLADLIAAATAQLGRLGVSTT